jgi:hypothetical protein
VLAIIFFFLSLIVMIAVLVKPMKKNIRMVAFLISIASLFGFVATFLPLELGALANLFLLFWVTLHFWFMGKFDH